MLHRLHPLKRTSRLLLQRHPPNLRRCFHSETVLSELEDRGFISAVTRREQLIGTLQASRQTVYSGIDPTARSLHVGHLLPMMCLVHFQLQGHHIIPLIGGATALIGDPSGRSAERPHLERAAVEEDMQKLTANVQTFFDRALAYAAKKRPSSQESYSTARVMNNIEWLGELGLLEFLRSTGTYARVNTMIARDSVQSRLKSQQGISFAEFSYQLLQAYDFLSLNKRAGCTIQIGGSDQWGNIIAGIELINRTTNSSTSGTSEGDRGFGITTPLLTTATGEKFGKSSGNAVWLDESFTSVFDFYQFFMRTLDDDIGRYLRLFTLLPLSTIDDIVSKHQKHPQQRIAQKILADEVTELVHTAQGLKRAQAATKVLFETDLTDILANDVLHAFRGDIRLHFVNSNEIFGVPVAHLAVRYKLAPSNGAVRTLVSSGGLYLNGMAVVSGQVLSSRDLIDGNLVILRAGKSKHAIMSLA